MNEIAGIPYTTAEFDEGGRCIDPPALPESAREVIIVSHGWNNDRGEAEDLYRELFTNFASVHPGGTDKFAIVGVIWPSKKFDFSPGELQRAGGVAAAAAGGASAEIERAEVERSLQEFERVFEGSGKEAQLATLRKLAPDIATPSAQTQFVETLRELVADTEAPSDLDGSKFFFQETDLRALFVNAKQGSAEVGAGEAQDGVAGAGLGDVFSGIGNAVSSLLNISTYYEMKKRAGTVGSQGLAPLVDQIGGRESVQHIHLVGHSFGARVVTAAAMASSTAKLYSLSLLQGAFSHSGFADIGYFRRVVSERRLAGPIIVTHTANDQAVGKAYAIASRISRDVAEELGDRNDKYGGLGRNGAINMHKSEVSKTAENMLDVGQAYELQKQLIHNLESSPYIPDHGGVRGRQVAWAISQAIASAG